jgi:hypothetical protein
MPPVATSVNMSFDAYLPPDNRCQFPFGASSLPAQNSSEIVSALPLSTAQSLSTAKAQQAALLQTLIGNSAVPPRADVSFHEPSASAPMPLAASSASMSLIAYLAPDTRAHLLVGASGPSNQCHSMNFCHANYAFDSQHQSTAQSLGTAHAQQAALLQTLIDICSAMLLYMKCTSTRTPHDELAAKECADLSPHVQIYAEYPD